MAAAQLYEKRSQTYKNKYGFTNPSQNPEIKQKKEQTTIKNYGVTHYTKTTDYKNRYT